MWEVVIKGAGRGYEGMRQEGVGGVGGGGGEVGKERQL